MSDKKAIIRGEMPGGAPRQAYNDLKDWAIDDLKPQIKKILRVKIKELSQKHGVSERDIIQFLFRPPAGETRTQLVEFLYDILFS